MNPDRIKPLIRKTWETSLGKVFPEFTPINAALSYGIDKNIVNIHLREISNYSNDAKRVLVISGLKKLAEIVASKPEITEITAVSPLITRYPRQIRKLGFRTTGPISEEMRQEHFKKEKKPVHGALMSREEFLAEYLHKDKIL